MILNINQNNKIEVQRMSALFDRLHGVYVLFKQ